MLHINLDPVAMEEYAIKRINELSKDTSAVIDMSSISFIEKIVEEDGRHYVMVNVNGREFSCTVHELDLEDLFVLWSKCKLNPATKAILLIKTCGKVHIFST
jgi:hypothetical protein